MWAWMSDNFCVLFGACVPIAFVFSILDVITNIGLKLVFLGTSNIRIGGGKIHD